MNSIWRYEQNGLHVIPLQDILKALLLIASILLAEGQTLFGRSCIAGDQSRLLASQDGTADDPPPTSNTDESHPYLILLCHEHFLLCNLNFPDIGRF
jgi:hypothetical protein